MRKIGSSSLFRLAAVWVVGLGLVGLLGCGGGGGAPDEPGGGGGDVGSIEGRVYVFYPIVQSGTRQPPMGYIGVPGAQIGIVAHPECAGTTNTDGYFRVDDIPVGAQTVRIDPPAGVQLGYLQLPITIVANQVTPVGYGGVVSLPHLQTTWVRVLVTKVDLTDPTQAEVHVAVCDPNNYNSQVLGIPASCFTVTVDGAQVGVAAFSQLSPTEQQPVSVCLVGDCSGSMDWYFGPSGTKREALIAAAQSFVEHMLPGDEVGVVRFGSYGTVELVSPFTTDLDALSDEIPAMFGVNLGATALYDAIYLGVETALGAHNPRATVLALTDGWENNSWDHPDPNESVNLATLNGITIYTIAIGEPGDYDEATLRYIAESTGGQFYTAGDQQDLSRVYIAIASQMHNTYVLTLDLSGLTTGQHTVQVLVNYSSLPGLGTVNFQRSVPRAPTPLTPEEKARRKAREIG